MELQCRFSKYEDYVEIKCISFSELVLWEMELFNLYGLEDFCLYVTVRKQFLVIKNIYQTDREHIHYMNAFRFQVENTLVIYFMKLAWLRGAYCILQNIAQSRGYCK